MTFPNIPNVTPSINLSRTQVVNLLLASIAFEELGLAHITNAEAEKIQAVLGTLPGISVTATSVSQLLSVNQSVNRTLRSTIKKEMLLQFKLEDILELPSEPISSTSSSTTTTTSSSTTTTSSSSTTTTSSSSTTTTSSSSTTTSSSSSTTTTTLTTTSSSTTTATVTVALCTNEALMNAVFAGRDWSVASASVTDNDAQVNGNLIISGSNNAFLGTTNVVGTVTDSGSSNSFENLNTGAASVPIKPFDPACLQNTADIVINGNVNITSEADAAIFQGRRVWVNGTVSVTGGDIAITGGGILARDGITVSGGNFTYTSTGCFAFYSQLGDILINNGPYDITGLVYTATTDIRLATSTGGTICGGVMSARDVIYTGGSAVHRVIDVAACSKCIACQNFCNPA